MEGPSLRLMKTALFVFSDILATLVEGITVLMWAIAFT